MTDQRDLTWGDVLCAAMWACTAVGIDHPVDTGTLPDDLRRIVGMVEQTDAAWPARPAARQTG